MHSPTVPQTIRQLYNKKRIKDSLCSDCYGRHQHKLPEQNRRKTRVDAAKYLDGEGRARASDTHKFALSIVDDHCLEVACKYGGSSRL